jgi:hypothetical protein
LSFRDFRTALGYGQKSARGASLWLVERFPFRNGTLAPGQPIVRRIYDAPAIEAAVLADVAAMEAAQDFSPVARNTIRLDVVEVFLQREGLGLESVLMGGLVAQWLVSHNDADFSPFTMRDLNELIGGASLFVWDTRDRSSRARLLFERPKPALSVVGGGA